MRVSVICVADRPERLPVLVWSLHAQTYRNWELLVLDQTSDGSAMRYLDTLPETLDAHIAVERVERVGDWGQSAKERAARTATVTGEVFIFPADDAYYVPTALATFVKALERGADMALCGWLCGSIRLSVAGHKVHDNGSGYVAKPPTPAVGHVDVGGFMVRRETFLAHGWPDKSHEGDGKLVLALLRSGARLAAVPDILYVKN